MAKGGLIALLGYSGSWILRGVVAFAASFVTFSVLLNRNALQEVRDELPNGVRILHTAYIWPPTSLLAIFGILSLLLYEGRISGIATDLVAVVWLASGLMAIALAAGAFIPFRLSGGNLWRWYRHGCGFMP